MEKAMLFDEATVTTTEKAVAAAVQKALPSHRLRYAVLLVLNVPCLNTLPNSSQKAASRPFGLFSPFL